MLIQKSHPPQNLVYIGAKIGAPPSKFSIYWRQRRIKKNFWIIHQKWISQNNAQGELLGRQKVESMKAEIAPTNSATATTR